MVMGAKKAGQGPMSGSHKLRRWLCGEPMRVNESKGTTGSTHTDDLTEAGVDQIPTVKQALGERESQPLHTLRQSGAGDLIHL